MAAAADQVTQDYLGLQVLEPGAAPQDGVPWSGFTWQDALRVLVRYLLCVVHHKGFHGTPACEELHRRAGRCFDFAAVAQQAVQDLAPRVLHALIDPAQALSSQELRTFLTAILPVGARAVPCVLVLDGARWGWFVRGSAGGEWRSALFHLALSPLERQDIFGDAGPSPADDPPFAEDLFARRVGTPSPMAHAGWGPAPSGTPLLDRQRRLLQARWRNVVDTIVDMHHTAAGQGGEDARRRVRTLALGVLRSFCVAEYRNLLLSEEGRPVPSPLGGADAAPDLALLLADLGSVS